jgi:DegV family protein with EDD domain
MGKETGRVSVPQENVIMTMEKTVIVADSCCDIPAKLANELGIRVLPVHIVYPDRDYLDDGVDLDPREVYRRFPDEIPHTSMPSPLEAEEFFRQIAAEGFTHVITVCISEHLSGTVGVVNSALKEIRELTGFVFDSKDISMGSGMYAVWAAKQLQAGRSFREICEELERKRPDSHLMFYMDTLEYLRKGGRIGNVSALVASILRLKPIIACDDEGIYYTVAKIRGEKKAKEHLLSEMEQAVGNKPCMIAVMNGGDTEGGEQMLRLVQSRFPNAKIVVANHQIAASLAVHTGPGLIGLEVFVLDEQSAGQSL